MVSQTALWFFMRYWTNLPNLHGSFDALETQAGMRVRDY